MNIKFIVQVELGFLPYPVEEVVGKSLKLANHFPHFFILRKQNVGKNLLICCAFRVYKYDKISVNIR